MRDELLADQLVVAVQHLTPAPVADLRCPLGGGDDVAEHPDPSLPRPPPAGAGQRAPARHSGCHPAARRPPAGGFLFSAAAWLPFGVDAASFAASSALVASIPAQHAAPGASGTKAPASADHRASLFADITEGLRWLIHHHVLRTMALLAAEINLLSIAHTAILVLFAQERLGLGSVGFGLLLTASAVGGLAGSVIAPWLSRHTGPAQVMVGGFVAGGLAKIGIGLTLSPWIAGGLLAATGMFPIIHSVILGSLRQRLIPDRLLGRVNSAYSLCTYGAVPLGAPSSAAFSPTASACRRRFWSPASSSR